MEKKEMESADDFLIYLLTADKDFVNIYFCQVALFAVDLHKSVAVSSLKL